MPVEKTPKFTDLHEQVFVYLDNHPYGTKLVELGQEFRLPRIMIARVLTELIAENMVEKQELLYFARR